MRLSSTIAWIRGSYRASLTGRRLCSSRTVDTKAGSASDAGFLSCEGLVQLRLRGHRGITELNLGKSLSQSLSRDRADQPVTAAANGVSDKGLLAIITHLLLPTAGPKSLQPTLHSLYLSGNKINLADKVVAALLATGLSHPSSSLHFLSLTSAPTIQLDHFLSLCYPTSLRYLLLNVCNIRHAKSLLDFLSNPDQGGRLEGTSCLLELAFLT